LNFKLISKFCSKFSSLSDDVSKKAQKSITSLMKKHGIVLSSFKFAKLEDIAKISGYSVAYTRQVLDKLFNLGRIWKAKNFNTQNWFYSLNDLDLPSQSEVWGDLIPSVDKYGHLIDEFYSDPSIYRKNLWEKMFKKLKKIK